MWCFTDKPQDDPNIRGDAFKTLIVARLSYDATEQDLESEFGRFGPIERVCHLRHRYILHFANRYIDPDCH
jgi:RNA recognition motif-containing protein